MAWTRGKDSVVDDSGSWTGNFGDCWCRDGSRNDNRRWKQSRGLSKKELRTSYKAISLLLLSVLKIYDEVMYNYDEWWGLPCTGGAAYIVNILLKCSGYCWALSGCLKEEHWLHLSMSILFGIKIMSCNHNFINFRGYKR